MGRLIALVITLTIMFFLTYYLCGRDLLAPPIIMTGMFIIGAVFATMNAVEWQIDYSFEAYIIIVTGIIAFDIPFFIYYQFSIKNRPEVSVYKKRIIHIEKWKVIFTIVLDMLVLFVYYCSIRKLVRNTGYSGSNIQFYFRKATSYEGTEQLNVIVRQLVKIIEVTAYIFTFIFVNNVIIYKSKLRKNYIYILPAIMDIIKSFMGGGRLDMLRLVAFFVIVAYILNQQKMGWKKAVSMKYMCIILVAFIIVLPAFYYTLSFAGRSTTRTMFQMISTYVGGPIQHFNQYIKEPAEPGRYYGTETFIPLLNMLSSFKLIDFHETVHLEYRRLGITSGNVYTFFRRPLHDFGILGMYIFTILVSIFFSRMYFLKVKYKEISYNTDFNIIIYSYFMYWIVLSSVEQYAVSYISMYTLITLFLLYLFWQFYIYTEINGCKIVIHKPPKLTQK